MSETRKDAVQEAEEAVAASGDAAAEHEAEAPEPALAPGDVVVVSENYHSSYFRGLVGVIDGESIKGGSGQTLWPLKIDVPPHRTLVPAKYLKRTEAGGASRLVAVGAGTNPQAKTPSPARGSLFSRLFSRGK